MRTCLAVALGLSAAFAVHAESGAPARQPNPHLAAAERLYQRLDLDAALAELKEAEAASKDNEDDMVQILIYRGLIDSETGRSAEAQDMFKRALAIRPWAEVPPDTSPRLAKVFSDTRKALWGAGGAVKPPPKKKAVPASTAQPSQLAVPATATPAK